MKKILIVLFLIAGMVTGCSQIKPISEEITIELGKILPENVSEHIKVPDEDMLSEIVMDFSQVDYSKTGDYTIKAIYQEKSEEITLHIVDTTAPEVKVNTAYVIVRPNVEVDARDCFSEIVDKAETIAGFINGEKISDLEVITDETLSKQPSPEFSVEDLKETTEMKEVIRFEEEGIYNVKLAVQDASKNTVTCIIPCYVDGTPPVMTCPKDQEAVINNAEGQFEIDIEGFTCVDNFDGDLSESEQSVLNLESSGFDETTMTEKFLATVTATDRAGNSSEISWNITVKNEFDYVQLVKDIAGIKDEVLYVNENSVSDGYHLELAKQIGDMLNASRAEAGLSQLVWDSTLEGTANIRAKEIVSVYSHTRPDGSAFNSMTNNTILSGENICRYGNGPADIHQSFMNSTDHRSIILTEALTRFAVSYYVENGVPYVVEHFGI